MNTLLNKYQANKEVAPTLTLVPEVSKKKYVLKSWVKKALLSSVITLGVSISTSIFVDSITTSEKELANEVTWVTMHAHKGDGLERVIRRANGTTSLDIKAMATIMENKNDISTDELKEHQSVLVPVLEAK